MLSDFNRLYYPGDIISITAGVNQTAVYQFDPESTMPIHSLNRGLDTYLGFGFNTVGLVLQDGTEMYVMIYFNETLGWVNKGNIKLINRI